MSHLKQDYPAQVYDWEIKGWLDVVVSITAGKVVLSHPVKSDSLGLSVHFKGKLFKKWFRVIKKRAGLEVRIDSGGRCLISFKNWARAAFGKPVQCDEKKIAMCKTDKTIKMDVGFPFDDPIIFRVPSISEEEFDGIQRVLDTNGNGNNNIDKV